jgi:GDP-L-fucose synthase
MKDKKVFIAGHRGMVGSSVLDLLKNSGFTNIITKTRQELDLTDSSLVGEFFKKENVDIVVLCAAKVGGIMANNSFRADFLYDNIQIASNVIKSSSDFGVEKLINLGSSCIYPRDAKIPIKEEYLLTGELEYTNEPYAIAKIAALKMCESFYKQYGKNFYSIMPCNLYGPRDNFDLATSHVLPALINKVHCAMERDDQFLEVWGTGKPLREFLYVDDLARAVLHCLESVDSIDIYSKGISHLNCGSNDEISISDLVKLIMDVVGYDGEIRNTYSKPDGTFRKKMDNTRISDTGFSPKVSLLDGVSRTYEWYLKNLNIDC